jgi:hypothetical protein
VYYAFREYELTEKQMARIVEKLAAKDAAANKSGKRKNWKTAMGKPEVLNGNWLTCAHRKRASSHIRPNLIAAAL